MKIQVYAVLKDYFEREFTLQQPFETIDTLKGFLIEKNPKAENILNISRFAVDNEIVENDYILNENDNISILPPSSGG
ncbi:MAG TPA: MoaD/ThiS family protein [Pedobacter sp.]|jgi:molybdopterin synthase sulfur carrier subunit